MDTDYKSSFEPTFKGGAKVIYKDEGFDQTSRSERVAFMRIAQATQVKEGRVEEPSLVGKAEKGKSKKKGNRSDQSKSPKDGKPKRKHRPPGAKKKPFLGSKGAVVPTSVYQMIVTLDRIARYSMISLKTWMLMYNKVQSRQLIKQRKLYPSHQEFVNYAIPLMTASELGYVLDLFGVTGFMRPDEVIDACNEAMRDNAIMAKLVRSDGQPMIDGLPIILRRNQKQRSNAQLNGPNGEVKPMNNVDSPRTSFEALLRQWNSITDVGHLYSLKYQRDGPDHQPLWTVRLAYSEHTATGYGVSKKKAEYKAFELMIEAIADEEQLSVVRDELGNLNRFLIHYKIPLTIHTSSSSVHKGGITSNLATVTLRSLNYTIVYQHIGVSGTASGAVRDACSLVLEEIKSDMNGRNGEWTNSNCVKGDKEKSFRMRYTKRKKNQALTQVEDLNVCKGLFVQLKNVGELMGVPMYDLPNMELLPISAQLACWRAHITTCRHLVDLEDDDAIGHALHNLANRAVVEHKSQEDVNNTFHVLSDMGLDDHIIPGPPPSVSDDSQSFVSNGVSDNDGDEEETKVDVSSVSDESSEETVFTPEQEMWMEFGAQIQSKCDDQDCEARGQMLASNFELQAERFMDQQIADKKSSPVNIGRITDSRLEILTSPNALVTPPETEPVAFKNTPFAPVQIILAQGGLLEYKGKVYQSRTGGWVPLEDGPLLPANIVVYDQPELIFNGKVREGVGYLDKSGYKSVLYSAFTVERGVIKAENFKWFRYARVWAYDAMHTITLGQTHRHVLYTHHTKHVGDMLLHRASMKLLHDMKSMSTVSDNNNKVCLHLLHTKFDYLPNEVIADCVLKFVEERANFQRHMANTCDAANAFLARPDAWVSPRYYDSHGISGVMSLKYSAPEGVNVFTTRDECIEEHSVGKVCCAREDYTVAHSSYDDYVDPYWDEKTQKCFNYNLIPNEDGSVTQPPGVTYDQYGLRFSTKFEKPLTPYSTLGTHFATQKGVINHKDVHQFELAHLRIFKPRDQELEKRAAAGAIYDRIFDEIIARTNQDCEFLDGGFVNTGKAKVFDMYKHMYDLETNIKKIDKFYRGNKSAHDQYVEKYKTAYKLSQSDKNYCSVIAALKRLQMKIELEKKGNRLGDRIEDLLEYIDETAIKVALRKAFVQAEIRGESVPKTFVDITFKPHEFQKYKAGKLKFGRLIMSLTGDAWIKANPTVFKDGKHVLEHPIKITYRHENIYGGPCSASDPKYVMTTQARVEYHGLFEDVIFTVPERNCKPRDFYGRAVLTQTSNMELSGIIENMEDICMSHAHSYSFINHGDDTLSCESSAFGPTWIEGDIADNDTSHNDAHFRILYLVDAMRGEDVLDAYTQLAMPTRSVNPDNPQEKVKLRYEHGMRLLSGSTNTTTANTHNSMNIGIIHSFFGGSYTAAALRMGFDVTETRGSVEDVCFLSRCFLKVNQRITTITDIASLIRGFGSITGDALGSSKELVCDRITRAQKDVVKGFVHEPGYLLMKVLRAKYLSTNLFDFMRDARQTAGMTNTDRMVFDRYKHKPPDPNRVVLAPFVDGFSDPNDLTARVVINPQPVVQIISDSLTTMEKASIFTNSCDSRYHVSDMTELDMSIVRHYYGDLESEGVNDYLACVNAIHASPIYGGQIFSRFIDACMHKRYGMAPVCV